MMPAAMDRAKGQAISSATTPNKTVRPARNQSVIFLLSMLPMRIGIASPYHRVLALLPGRGMADVPEVKSCYSEAMIHEIFPVGVLQCNCSVVGDEQSKEAMVIDPGDEIEHILSIVAQHGLTVKQIVITHAHIDHVGGAMKLKAA